jgi:hypothetical protein
VRENSAHTNLFDYMRIAIVVRGDDGSGRR